MEEAEATEPFKGLESFAQRPLNQVFIQSAHCESSENATTFWLKWKLGTMVINSSL